MYIWVNEQNKTAQHTQKENNWAVAEKHAVQQSLFVCVNSHWKMCIGVRAS